ncbi:hypothetical protein ACIBQ1_35180 [Nonomuraea sp. NPDC050153]|uniref:hypothetical protein n=1 Tax=Nonomuraea sp. NPDC050153 TaxID=3364359 RepID=UPI0037B593BD
MLADTAGADAAGPWGAAGISSIGIVMLLGACAALIRWRIRRRAARRERARRAVLALATAVEDVRTGMRDATTRQERGVALARWRSRWMYAAAMIALVDPVVAKDVRAQGRRLYADLMAVEVLGAAWPVGGMRRESSQLLHASARDLYARCCSRS